MVEHKTIAVGGFQHETNTFAAIQATFTDFEKHDGWPGLTRGEELLHRFAGMNIPLAGFLNAAERHRLVPLLWCAAEPSAHVTKDAFERIVGMLCEDLAAAGSLDGVFLDLHGAMVVEHHEDGEGEVLRRVREVIGDELPLVASLDFHANITEKMMVHADAFAVYRTYPHLDMEHCGRRAFVLLERLLDGRTLNRAFRKVPFLIPLTAQCTDFEPNVTLFHKVAELERGSVRNVDFAEGFPAADINECGPAVIAYADTEAQAEAAAEELYQAVLSAETNFRNDLWDPREAVEHAMQVDGGPVVLADVQDNAGAGAHSDTVGLLAAMVELNANNAVLAILHDPEIAALAYGAGCDAELEGALGAKIGTSLEAPLQARFRVEALSDGCFACTGEMYRGSVTDLGPMALLRILSGDAGVRVIVGSHRFQCLDRAIFTHLGVNPAEQQIVGVKSTVHFRADFDPIAVQTLAVQSPGVHHCRITDIPYENLRRGVRLGPTGPLS